MNASQPKPDSTSSAQTEDFAHSKEVLALGQKLVDELGLEPSVDTLGRWMAHYVAELMVAAKVTSGEDAIGARRRCFDAILTLWKGRAELPDGKRPFEDMEPIIRAIASLDPNDDTPRYFRSVRRPNLDSEEISGSDSWLEMASGLDYSAKILIGDCLREAARAAIDKSKDWVKLAEDAGEADGPSEIVIRFVSNKADLEKESDPNGPIRRMLQDRVKRLDAFVKLATVVGADLAAQLEALPPASESAEDQILL